MDGDWYSVEAEAQYAYGTRDHLSALTREMFARGTSSAAHLNFGNPPP